VRKPWTVVLLWAAACGEAPISPPDVLQVPGELEPAVAPAGYEGPADFVGFRYAFKGQLSRTGIGVGHLFPEAGDMDRVPWMWIGCYVRENAENPYISIDPVEGSSSPCGFRWHGDHLDGVVESPRTPLWEALVVVIVL
jgi:hypothetical protein